MFGHVFRTALLTGARKGELCKLRWDHIDWGAMVMQVVGTKTEHRSEQTVRYLKITDTLAEILQERMGESLGVYVFTREGGEVTHYYQIFAEACKAVGIAYGREVPGGFVTHDARHTAVTRMPQSGRDLATIGSITGHKDKTLICTTDTPHRRAEIRPWTCWKPSPATRLLDSVWTRFRKMY